MRLFDRLVEIERVRRPAGADEETESFSDKQNGHNDKTTTCRPLKIELEQKGDGNINKEASAIRSMAFIDE